MIQRYPVLDFDGLILLRADDDDAVDIRGGSPALGAVEIRIPARMLLALADQLDVILQRKERPDAAQTG